MKWKDIDIKEISFIGGIGGRFGKGYASGTDDVFYRIILKNGEEIKLQYDDGKSAYNERYALWDEYIKVNNIENKYHIKNDIYVEYNDQSHRFGVRVEDLRGYSEYKTYLEVEKLYEEDKIIDDGYRQLTYICPLKIKGGKIMFGELKDNYKEQLLSMGFKLK